MSACDDCRQDSRLADRDRSDQEDAEWGYNSYYHHHPQPHLHSHSQGHHRRGSHHSHHSHHDHDEYQLQQQYSASWQNQQPEQYGSEHLHPHWQHHHQAQGLPTTEAMDFNMAAGMGSWTAQYQPPSLYGPHQRHHSQHLGHHHYQGHLAGVGVGWGSGMGLGAGEYRRGELIVEDE